MIYNSGIKVSNTPLRERYLFLQKTEGLTLADVAVRCGWIVGKKKREPDSSRVGRNLGINQDEGRLRTEIDEEMAIVLCRALELEPWEVDL